MNEPYPIVKRVQFARRPSHGFLIPDGLRPGAEASQLRPHEVLVYQVGEEFIVDDGDISLEGNKLVNANCATVVNMCRDTYVKTEFPISSRDGLDFTVYVGFLCTVLDPVAVVREAQCDVADELLSYLKGYQPLFELGLNYALGEIGSVRRQAVSHLNAYMTVNPPQIASISVTFADVDVIGSKHDEKSFEIEQRRQEPLADNNFRATNKKLNEDEYPPHLERAPDGARERQKARIEVELEILRNLTKRGLLDNYYPDINELIERIRGERGSDGRPSPTSDDESEGEE